MSGLTIRRSQSPLAFSVPLSRFASRVGGGSDFYVRPQLPHNADVQFNMKRAALVFVVLVLVSLAFRFWQHEPSLPVAIHPSQVVAVRSEQAARGDFASRLREIIARANASGDKAAFGKTTFIYDHTSINAPPLRPNNSLQPTAAGPSS